MKKMFSIFLIVLLSFSMVTPVFAVATPSDASLEDYLANYEKIPLPADNPGLGVVEEWEGDDGNLVASNSDWDFEVPVLGSPIYVPPGVLASSEGGRAVLYGYTSSGVTYSDLGYSGDVFSLPVPADGSYYVRFWFDFYRESFPSPGTYKMNVGLIDYARTIRSTGKDEVSADYIVIADSASNVNQQTNMVHVTITFKDNQWHVQTNNIVEIGYNTTTLAYNANLYESAQVKNISLLMRFSFDFSSAEPNLKPPSGNNTTSDDVVANNSQQIVQNTASMSDTLKEIVQTISKQLEALWNQQYNYIHLEDMANADKNADKIVNGANQNTQEIIDNADENTDEVTGAIEEHGNFIIEGLKGLFIPDDAFFKAYFDDLHGWFSDRFGFLSFPLDLLVRLVELFTQSEDVDCVLTLPSFSIMDEQLWAEQSFNLTEFLETHFMFLLTAIRMVTSIYLIMSFVHLCEDKWNEVMMN